MNQKWRRPVLAGVAGIDSRLGENSGELERAVRKLQDKVDYGDKWDDVQGSIREGDKNSTLTWEAFRDTSLLLGFMRHDQNDELHFVYQMPHRWNRKNVKPHIHIIPMSAGAGVFAMNGHWAWARYRGHVPALASWHTFTSKVSLTAADQYRPRIIGLDNVTPAPGCKESACLLLYVRRDGPNDTYTTSKDHGTAAANVAVLSCDTHYQAEKLGTEKEYPGAAT